MFGEVEDPTHRVHYLLQTIIIIHDRSETVRDKLLCSTNRKSHTGFLLVLKVTVNGVLADDFVISPNSAALVRITSKWLTATEM